MSFDTIPEDMVEGYPCDCGGSITLTDQKWCCDSCDFEKTEVKKILLPKWKIKAMEELRAMTPEALFNSFVHECTDRLSGRCEWTYYYSVELFYEKMGWKND